MEWVILIIALLLFGRNIAASLNVGGFTNNNAVPTPDGIPFMTGQDTNALNTANAPAPWKSLCTVNQPAVSLAPVSTVARPVSGVRPVAILGLPARIR